MDPRASVLENWLAKLIARGVRDVDEECLRVVLDRIVGKVREHAEIPPPDPREARRNSMTREERAAEILRLQRLREMCGDD